VTPPRGKSLRTRRWRAAIAKHPKKSRMAFEKAINLHAQKKTPAKEDDARPHNESRKGCCGGSGGELFPRGGGKSRGKRRQIKLGTVYRKKGLEYDDDALPESKRKINSLPENTNIAGKRWLAAGWVGLRTRVVSMQLEIGPQRGGGKAPHNRRISGESHNRSNAASMRKKERTSSRKG